MSFETNYLSFAVSEWFSPKMFRSCPLFFLLLVLLLVSLLLSYVRLLSPCQLIADTTLRVHFVFCFSIYQSHWVLGVLIANFKKKTTIKKWRTLLTVKWTYDAIMQLSYCPPFIPHIARTLMSLPSTRFLHVSPPILPCILHVVHVPRYLIYISLFYYSLYWDPVPERTMSAKGIKLLLRDCF